MNQKPHHDIGPKEQKHGFRVEVVHEECTGTIYTNTAEEARIAAFNLNQRYSGIISLSIVGY